MGVPGMKTILSRRPRWSTNLRLKETKLVIDITDEMYWFTKTRLLSGQEKMDRFGMNMVAYGQFFKKFIDRLRQAKITPIIVYNGARLSELKYGPLVAKTKHLERSTQIRLYKMRKRGPRKLDDQVIPSIACNVLKQIVSELQLEAHQSTYEVYPLLVRLANENDCPVLTSHRDFILANVKRGFLLFEEFDQQQYGRHQLEFEINCPNLYEHKRMLNDLNKQNSPALYCLNVLLRPDFCGKYFEVLNRMFAMRNDLRFVQDNTEFIENHRPPRHPWARRVEYILGCWPNTNVGELTDVDSVRRVFEINVSQVYRRKVDCDMAMRDYDALLMSFTDDNDRDNISALLPDHLGNIVNVQDALIRRESTATFLTDCLMGLTNIDRLRIEDLSTFRSTYSLADPVKLLLMNKGRLQSLKVFDRQYSHLQWRDLKAMSSLDVQELVHGIEAPPDQMLYDVFLFPNQISSPSNLRAYIRDSKVRGQLMKVALAFKDRESNREGPGSSLCEQLIVLLRLVVYGFKLGFRENYDLPQLKRSDSGSKSKSPNSTKPASPTAVKSVGSLQASRPSQSGSLTEKLRPNEVKYRKIQLKYIEAVYNSFMYHCFTRGYLIDRLDQDELLCDTDSGGFYAKVHLAKQEIESNKINKPSDVDDTWYLEIKHLNEMLNSSMHAYMELNSLYNRPGVVLKPADYFDCVQIYKICSYLLKASKSSLLEIEQSDRLYNLISDYLE